MASNHKVRKVDSSVLQIREALEGYRAQHPRAQVGAYRYNPSCIRVRVIDPDFQDHDLVEREERVWAALQTAPGRALSDISLLVAITPDEAEFSGSNLKFEDNKPADL